MLTCLRYFEHVECESPYDYRRLLENATVWICADIKTHYTLGNTTVTRNEGGSSVKVSLGEDNKEKLEIFVSANKQMRDCALIVDLPKQLVAALKLEPADLPDLSSLLSVPRASLKVLQVKMGFTSGNTEDENEEHLVADLVNDNSRSRRGSSSDDSGDDSSMTFRSGVSSETSTSQVHLQNHQNSQFDESPRDRPFTPHLTAAGLYSSINRDQNRTRIQRFAQNADLISSSRGEIFQFGAGGGIFHMSALREALDANEPASVSTPVHIGFSPHRRPNPIRNRNEEEKGRDTEVGFLGEQFVRSQTVWLARSGRMGS